jgi:hypothetical protein
MANFVLGGTPYDPAQDTDNALTTGSEADSASMPTSNLRTDAPSEFWRSASPTKASSWIKLRTGADIGLVGLVNHSLNSNTTDAQDLSVTPLDKWRVRIVAGADFDGYLAPDVLVTQTNLSGSITDVDDYDVEDDPVAPRIRSSGC